MGAVFVFKRNAASEFHPSRGLPRQPSPPHGGNAQAKPPRGFAFVNRGIHPVHDWWCALSPCPRARKLRVVQLVANCIECALPGLTLGDLLNDQRHLPCGLYVTLRTRLCSLLTTWPCCYNRCLA